MNTGRLFPWVTLALMLIGCGTQGADSMKNSTNPNPWAPLARYIEDRTAEFDAIPADRKAELEALAAFVVLGER